MSDVVIQATGLSKRYRLGVLNASSLKEDLILWWQRTRNPGALPEGEHSFWALKDIDFEIRRGDVVGLIGKNGAGKSTLLKIISRVVLPTTGSVRGKGRIASLLEVGTGFHPELTGRENIFLNGNILGMKKHEVIERFDEIVDFSGIGAFLDTPVKRYSSGMYVRLAFSIAIHLNPDILILDEVLAVGDAEFQQKCLDKIKTMTEEHGQTILFVSHSMHSVKTLCNRAIYLERGQMIAYGEAESVVSKYLLREQVYVPVQEFPDMMNAPGNYTIRVNKTEIQANNRPVSGPIDIQDDISLTFSFWKLVKTRTSLRVKVVVINFLGEGVFGVHSREVTCEEGLIHGRCRIPKGFLAEGSYIIHLIFLEEGGKVLFEFDHGLSFEIRSSRRVSNIGRWQTPVHPDFPIVLTQTT